MKLFLYAINDETNSLRHLDNRLVNPNLRKVIRIDEISHSQLSRAIRALDSSMLMYIFSQLLLLVYQQQKLGKNILEPTAEEIGKMYKSRWQIKLFFKHIKQHMTIKNYFSKSEDSVVNQIILAMIVYLLTLLMKLELALEQIIFQILRVFRAVQFNSYDYFVEISTPG